MSCPLGQRSLLSISWIMTKHPLRYELELKKRTRVVINAPRFFRLLGNSKAFFQVIRSSILAIERDSLPACAVSKSSASVACSGMTELQCGSILFRAVATSPDNIQRSLGRAPPSRFHENKKVERWSRPVQHVFLIIEKLPAYFSSSHLSCHVIRREPSITT